MRFWRNPFGSKKPPSQPAPSQAPAPRGHTFGENAICTQCGRSQSAASQFGWLCNGVVGEPAAAQPPPTEPPHTPRDPERHAAPPQVAAKAEVDAEIARRGFRSLEFGLTEAVVIALCGKPTSAHAMPDARMLAYRHNDTRLAYVYFNRIGTLDGLKLFGSTAVAFEPYSIERRLLRLYLERNFPGNVAQVLQGVSKHLCIEGDAAGGAVAFSLAVTIDAIGPVTYTGAVTIEARGDKSTLVLSDIYVPEAQATLRTVDHFQCR